MAARVLQISAPISAHFFSVISRVFRKTQEMASERLTRSLQELVLHRVQKGQPTAGMHLI